MFVVGLLSWWYGRGWKQHVAAVRASIASLYDYFSFDLLLRTLFSPFRQISAGKTRGSLSIQFRAWVDRLVSRTIGAIVRTGLLLIGLVALAVRAIVGVVSIVVWAIVPFVPVVGIIVAILGWVPWHI